MQWKEMSEREPSARIGFDDIQPIEGWLLSYERTNELTDWRDGAGRATGSFLVFIYPRSGVRIYDTRVG